MFFILCQPTVNLSTEPPVLPCMFSDSPWRNGGGLRASLVLFTWGARCWLWWEEQQLPSSRPRAVGTVGQSARGLNLRLFYSCWSQREPVLLLALLSPPCFPCCALRCCRGSIWELLTCRACENWLRREETAKRKTQVVLRGAGESLGRPGDMSLLNVLLLPGATGHSIPGVSPSGCGSASGGWRAVSHQARLVFCALLMPCCPEGSVIPSPACQASLPLLWLGTVLFLCPIPTAIHAAEGWWWWGVKRLPQVCQH